MPLYKSSWNNEKCKEPSVKSYLEIALMQARMGVQNDK